MKNLNILLLLTIALFTFGCNDAEPDPGSKNSISAEVDGASWVASSIQTTTNDQGELFSVEAKATDNTTIKLQFIPLEMDVLPTDLPTDIDGNLLATKIKVTSIPDMTEVRYNVELNGIQSNVSEFILESTDDGAFIPVQSISLSGSSLNETITIPNTRNSNNDFLQYRVKLIYDTTSMWNSPIDVGTTSLRCSYDNGPTMGQSTGDFNLTSYEGKKMSGNFSFETNSGTSVRKGLIVDLEF